MAEIEKPAMSRYNLKILDLWKKSKNLLIHCYKK